MRGIGRLLGVIAVLVMTEAMEVNLLAFLSPCVADAWSLGAVDEASLARANEQHADTAFLHCIASSCCCQKRL